MQTHSEWRYKSLLSKLAQQVDTVQKRARELREFKR